LIRGLFNDTASATYVLQLRMRWEDNHEWTVHGLFKCNIPKFAWRYCGNHESAQSR